MQINADRVILVGEGEYLVDAKILDASDAFQQRSALSMQKEKLNGLIPQTKRVAYCAASSDMALGRTSGEVVLIRKSGDKSVLNLIGCA